MFTLPPFLNDFFIILFSIVVEGIPFILIGALLSGIMEFWITPERIAKTLPKSKIGKYLSMIFLGNIMPVCECGNIPFARRLILKKVPPHLALVFLLAAPVINPIVILSTLAAFSNDLSVTIYRILFTIIVAISLGFLISFLPKTQLLKSNLTQKDSNNCCNHNHPTTHKQNSENKVKKHKNLATLISQEFLEMTGIFIFGATIATTIQLFLPKDFVLGFNQQEWISIIAMMLLAFVVSICSNVDAFFALAYAQIFPTSSILAFLVFGPMIDIKAIPMLKTVFTWRAVSLIIAFTAIITFLLSYLYFLFT